MRHRLLPVLALALSAAALLVPARHAAAQEHQPLPNWEYIPFVTDFPKAEAPDPAATSAASELDWGSVGIAGGVGAALGALLAASGLGAARRARPAPC
jgi:hypothetical protein